MKKIVLVSYGSLGDLNPYLSVGTLLQHMGYSVTMACSERFKYIVMRAHLNHVSIPPDLTAYEKDGAFQKKGLDPRSGAEFIIKSLFLPFLCDSYKVLIKACQDAELIVSHILAFAVPSVAEKLQIPWIQVFLQPTSLFSIDDPSRIAAIPFIHQLPVGRRYVYAALYAYLRKSTTSWFRGLGALRLMEGLAENGKHPLFEAGSPYGTFGWFSSCLAPPQLDWPKTFQLVGFPRPPVQSSVSLDPEAEDFIRVRRPLVFTLGSTAVFQPGTFYNESVAAASDMKLPAVLLGSSLDVTGKGTFVAKDILALRYLPYENIFPYARTVVHHAGMGCVHQSLRAGVPTLVVPFTYDQPDNAYRLTRLGVALTLNRKDYTKKNVVKRLRELTGDSYSLAAASELAKRVITEEAANGAANAIKNKMLAL